MTWKWIDIIATCKASIPNDRLNQAADVHPHLECVDKSQSCLTATLSTVQPLQNQCDCGSQEFVIFIADITVIGIASTDSMTAFTLLTAGVARWPDVPPIFHIRP